MTNVILRRSLTLLSVFTLFLFTGTAEAGVIRDNATHFSKLGSLDSFRWAPATYQDADHPNDFQYDIFYYIPRSLKNTKQAKSLIFLHGGGPITSDRAGSIKVVYMYTNDLIEMAEELGIVVVLPSANGLNWAGHTQEILHELAALMRSELDLNSNYMGVSGHSMGGMGITRIFSVLTDEFSFFLPMASGVDTSIYSADTAEWIYNKAFNVPYIALEGVRDSFPEFITNCKKQETVTTALETKYGLQSKLQVLFYDSDHNYQYGVFRETVRKALKTPRDLYQKELFGTIQTADRWLTENNILFRWQEVPRYFWVEAVNPDVTNSKYELFNFHAKVENNTVNLDLMSIPKNTQTLRIYFSSKMEDLTAPVDIVINGMKVATRDPLRSQVSLRSFAANDPGFLYEDSMDVAIPAATPTAAPSTNPPVTPTDTSTSTEPSAAPANAPTSPTIPNSSN
jgi:hypothetical protein